MTDVAVKTLSYSTRAFTLQNFVLLQAQGNVEAYGSIAAALAQIWGCSCPSVLFSNAQKFNCQAQLTRLRPLYFCLKIERLE